MSEHALLLRHAASWAEAKNRPLDPELLETILDLRHHQDGAGATSWPRASVERALLGLWPAYGPDETPPARELVATLDTYWRFLRATGRLSSDSAQPGDLVKEARRAAPRMAEVAADPAHHSQAKVLARFGREVGIDLDGAASLEDLQSRLDAVTSAWNALPQEERFRRMPDTTPKGARGEAFTAALHDSLHDSLRDPSGSDTGSPGPADPWRAWEYEEGDEDDGPDEWPVGDPVRAAAEVRDCGFVRKCLELRDWVGSGRETTSRGLLRPAVARQAYAALDLWEWERTSPVRPYALRDEASAEEEALIAEASTHSWSSAGDCLPLDRLWFAIALAELVEVRGRRAVATSRQPATDAEWLELGHLLVLAHCHRLGLDTAEPLVGALMIGALAKEDADGEAAEVPIDAIRAWWDSRWADGRGLAGVDELVKRAWRERLDRALAMFDDCGLWHRDRKSFTVTDFGVEFLPRLASALAD